MNQLKCTDCPYYWADNNPDRPYCHYRYNDGCAPCEIEDADEYTEPEHDEFD